MDELPSDNSLMLVFEKEGEALAGRLRVSKLSDFYDYGEIDQAIADILAEYDERATKTRREGEPGEPPGQPRRVAWWSSQDVAARCILSPSPSGRGSG